MKNKKSPSKKLTKAPVAKAATPPPAGLHQAVHGIFEKIQKKTGLNNDKIDQFQKEWMALPANRKKYEHLTDAPVVAIEEGVAIANDILDYLEGQGGGQSLVFKALKAEAHELAKHPVDYLKGKFEKAESVAKSFMNKIQEEAKKFQKKDTKKQ